MASLAKPPSQASEISPLRSVVFLGLAFTSFSASILTLNLRLVPDFLVIAFNVVSKVTYIGSIIGCINLIEADETQDRGALIVHFRMSMVMSVILCISRFIEKGGLGGFTSEDFNLCMNMAIWTVTGSMLSAIWVRRGVEGLKREAEAVPGNLWLFVYGQESMERRGHESVTERSDTGVYPKHSDIWRGSSA